MPIITPVPGSNTIVSASASNTSTQLTSDRLTANTLCLVNAGPNTVFVRLGVGAQTASVTTDMPILNGERVYLRRGVATYLGSICASTQTASLHVSAVAVEE